MQDTTRALAFTLILIAFNLFSGCSSPPSTAGAAPEALPEKMEQPKTITFRVDPSAFYQDQAGYTGIGYMTRREKIEKVRALLEKKQAPPEDYAKEEAKIPEFGYIIIHIGRQDLMHANTRWYTYSAVINGRSIFRINGQEGIPNIRGRDGNWWNLVEIPLREEIKDKIEVTVSDKKTGRDYRFSVTREET